MAAATVLHRVLVRGRSLTDALSSDADLPEPARLRAICYGVLRHLPLLRALLRGLMRSPLKSREAELEMLLLAAIFELGWMRTPEHAVIHEAVSDARALGKSWATGLVNAVLRAYQRAGKPRSALDLSAEERLLHPRWLIEALGADWPREFEAIIAANNAPAPLWLRVNAARGNVEDYLRRLSDAGIEAAAHRWAPHALRLERPVAVEHLPGFAEGEVSVQDLAAQLAAPLLAPRSGQRALDACAAPGGKSAHLLELNPRIELTALDVDPARSEQIGATLARLGLEARVVVADAADDAWWDGRPFERILLDAPCSATGVIRRHPDIKWLRRDADLDALSRTQRRLLRALWPKLAPGGRLLYATCSVLARENQQVVAAFLADHADARAVPIEAEWGRERGPGRQVVSGEDDADGFYYALLEKR